MPGRPQCKSGPEITRLLGVTIYSTIGIARRVGGQGPSQIEMLPMIKMSQKRLLLFLQFLLASSRTTAINNIIDPRGTGPLNLIFANQFKCITRVKLRIFFLKVANAGRHLTFL